LVNVWDGAHKKRLCQWADYPASIASLSFTPDGRRVAIAASYTFEEGNQPASQDQIFVREVGDKEFAPKAAKGGAKASRGGAA
jgi:cell cycle arrest protein BUB3